MATRQAEPTVRSIIEAARANPQRAKARTTWIVCGLSAALTWASFFPLDWGPLGWIALVPLMLLIRPAQRPRQAIAASYVCGLVSTACSVQWLRYGDPAMYLAIVALSVYLACYWPAFVLLGRAAVHRFRIPFVLALPTIWVGLDYFRAYLFTGDTWYSLGHTQYRWIELIQISDLVGAYGVTFVVVAAGAALAAASPQEWWTRRGGSPQNAAAAPAPSRWHAGAAVAFSLGLCAAALAYGYVRRSQADFSEGPRIALVQGNFTSRVKHDASEANSIFYRHWSLTGMAVRHQPDIIVWPETMYRDPLMLASPDLSEADLHRIAPRMPVEAWKSGRVQQQLHELSQQAGAAMIVGLDTLVADGGGGMRHYNSAALSIPQTGVVSRYDKIHRMIFGEYVPLADWVPFLRAAVPYGPGFGLDAGAAPVAFRYKRWTLAPVICFEDTVPQLVRGMLNRIDETQGGEKSVDCLVNLTNDGWFHGSSGLDQHLVTGLFRCVEFRTPMVRAVNTGISAVIDGDGMVVEPDVFVDADGQGRVGMRDPASGRWRRELNAVLVDSIPLDPRTSLYLRYGDWFAGSCGAAVLLLALAGLVPGRWFRRPAAAPAA
jgi:apolipoprotein N-acyltransferase